MRPKKSSWNWPSISQDTCFFCDTIYGVSHLSLRGSFVIPVFLQRTFGLYRTFIEQSLAGTSASERVRVVTAGLNQMGPFQWGFRRNMTGQLLVHLSRSSTVI